MSANVRSSFTQTLGLDHINIVVRDMDVTARFYQDVFGLKPKAPPGQDVAKVCWMYDEAGAPIVHLVTPDSGMFLVNEVTGERGGGAIHHVALRCSGHAGMCARLEALGIHYDLNDFMAVQLRQIFISDPNEVLLELNFYAGQH